MRKLSGLAAVPMFSPAASVRLPLLAVMICTAWNAASPDVAATMLCGACRLTSPPATIWPMVSVAPEPCGADVLCR